MIVSLKCVRCGSTFQRDEQPGPSSTASVTPDIYRPCPVLKVWKEIKSDGKEMMVTKGETCGGLLLEVADANS